MPTPDYLAPAELNTSPGPEYADEARQFQGIPSIERAANGRLWAVWYGGGITENRDNYLMAVTSADDGETWSGLKLVIDPDGPGPVRTFDATLWHDPQGRMWLFYSQSYEGDIANRCCVWASVTENSGDEDPVWSAPRPIADGVSMNRPTLLTSGMWFLPAAHWTHEPSATVIASTDGGKTFELIGGATVPVPEHRSADEHMVVERRDDSLWMLVRTGYGIGESVSTDGGRTWTDVEESPIKHTTSRFHLSRLQSGALLLVKHGRLAERGERRDLTAYISNDDGATWTGGLMIDDRLGVSYPDAVQAPDGTVYLIYDFDRLGEKEILLARFTEDDLHAGAFASERAAQRLLVNKAFGLNPRARS